MWDYDSFVAKARFYFEKAETHGSTDDEEFALWLLLGLEFLSRAPLAKIHPSLLALPEGPSIMHANGLSVSDSEPKSIPMHTVITRLETVIPTFASTAVKDLKVLLALRNTELHSAESALASISVQAWLPLFTRVADAVCEHLSLDLSDLVGDEISALGRGLVDTENKKLRHEVATRIDTAKAVFAALLQDEVATRVNASRTPSQWPAHQVACPACTHPAWVHMRQGRVSSTRVEDDDLVYEQLLLAQSLECRICSLVLNTTAEVKEAGLPQYVTEEVRESFYDRMVESYADYEYGND